MKRVLTCSTILCWICSALKLSRFKLKRNKIVRLPCSPACSPRSKTWWSCPRGCGGLCSGSNSSRISSGRPRVRVIRSCSSTQSFSCCWVKPRRCRLSRLGGCIYTGVLLSTAISGKDTKEGCFSNWLSIRGRGVERRWGGPAKGYFDRRLRGGYARK